MSLIRELWAFMKVRKKFWLLPIIVVLMMVGGLLVFAKSPDVKEALQAQFQERTVERVYVAVVEGRVAASSGTLRARC